MTTYQQSARAKRPALSISPTESFQRGCQSGVQAARQEMRHGGGATSAHAMREFIATRLDPEHMERQRDAARNPLPPAYHAGFVAGYLATLFAPGPVEGGGHSHD